MAEYRIRFVADASAAGRSISDLQKAIKAVTKEFEKAEIGADEFLEAASDLSKLKKELTDARNAVVNIDRAYQSLNKAIDANFAAANKASKAAEDYNKKLLGLANEQLQAEDQARRKNFQAEVDDWDKRFNLAVAQSKKIAAQQRGIMEFRAGMGARGAIPEIASPIRGGAGQFGSPAYFDALDKSLKEAIGTSKEIGPKPESFAPASLAAYESKLRSLKNEARLIAPETSRWRELTKEIIKTEKAVENINRRQSAGPSAQARLGAAGGAFLYGGGLGGGIGSALGGIAGGLAGGVPGAFTGAAIGQAVDGLGQYAAAMARTVAEVNKARIALAGVVKDQADYDRAIAASTEISKNFLLPIDQATRQFTKLQASVVGAGGKTQDTKQVFNGIAAAIIATGGSAEDLNGALTATAQVFSKGKVTAEELRGQIGERLPGAFTIFAQSINKTPQELDKALEKGQVSLADFLKFTQELTRRYAETAKILADAPENAGARLQVALTAASVAYGGFFQRVGAGFQDYATKLLEFAINNERQFKTFIATVRVAAEDFYTIFSGVINSIGPLFENFFKYIFSNFARGLNALADLASESQRAAGGPEKRAALAVQSQYGPLGQLFGNPFEKRKAYEEALRVELEYDKKQDKIARDRQSRIAGYVEKWTAPVRPPKFGMGLGTTSAGLTGDGAEKEKAKKEKRIPLEQLLDLESQRKMQMEASNKELRLAQLITQAKLSGNDAEAESLKSLSGALKIQGKISVLQEFVNMLIEKEGEIIGKSLTEKEFNNKLQDSNVELYKLQNELQKEFLDLQVSEKNQADKAQEALKEKLKKQQELNALLEDAAIAAGQISPQQAAVLQQRRGFATNISRATELGATPEQISSLQQLQMATPEAGSVQEYIRKLREELQQLISVQNLAAVSAQGIGDALGEAMTTGVASLISGTATAKEVFASFLQSVGQALSQAASQMIATYIAIGIAKMFAGLSGGAGGDYGSGKVATNAFQSTDALGLSNSISGGGAAFGASAGTFSNANFGVGAFANGGVVSGPTLSLIGEGKYNEAVVPLPDGRSIPVQLGGRSARDLMGNGAPGMPQAPSLSMKFETTKINGVEYVSREQLEQAMAETRRASIAGGAKQGMSMTLDKIKQSPSTRSRIGMR
jgi:tape measure domain-containing protein